MQNKEVYNIIENSKRYNDICNLFNSIKNLDNSYQKLNLQIDKTMNDFESISAYIEDKTIYLFPKIILDNSIDDKFIVCIIVHEIGHFIYGHLNNQVLT